MKRDSPRVGPELEAATVSKNAISTAGTVYAKVCRSLIAGSNTQTAEARIPFVAAGTLLQNAWTAGGRFARSAEWSAAEIHSAITATTTM